MSSAWLRFVKCVKNGRSSRLLLITTVAEYCGISQDMALLFFYRFSNGSGQSDYSVYYPFRIWRQGSWDARRRYNTPQDTLPVLQWRALEKFSARVKPSTLTRFQARLREAGI